ncbi:MAG: hypothetical protein INR71_06520 [Terriglobus roseus]|nr:hypothetical protein [Terriglobus roseus]
MLLSQNLQLQTSDASRPQTHHGTGSSSNYGRLDADATLTPVSPIEEPLPLPEIVVSRFTPTPTRGLQELDGRAADRAELDSHEVPRHELPASAPSPPSHMRPAAPRTQTAPAMPAAPDASSGITPTHRRPTPFDRVGAPSPLSCPHTSSAAAPPSSRTAPAAPVFTPVETPNRAMHDRFTGGVGLDRATVGNAGTRAIKGPQGRVAQMTRKFGANSSDTTLFFPQRVG